MIPGVFSHGQFKVFFQYMISFEFSSQEVYFLLHRSNKPNPYPILDDAGMTLLSHFFFIFIEVSLQYNVMLVSAVQQSESVIAVCYCSVTQLCLTLCYPMNCSTPGFPVLHHLPELAQTHVHWVSDALQPSCPLSSPSPPAFNLSQHWGLF